jgi:hypothetical protein
VDGKKIRLNSGKLVTLTVLSENGSTCVRAEECFDPHATHPPTVGRTVGYLEEADLLYTYRAQIVI